MQRRKFVATLGAGFAGAFLPALPPLSPLPRLKRERFVERWSWAMGQAVHVIVYAESEDQGLDACALALAELRRIEAKLSLFDDASELCELNRRAGKRPLRVSTEMLLVLGRADHYRVVTEGAFNAAVEPLMQVWGFHRSRNTMPTPTEVAAARESVATATLRRVGDHLMLLPNSHAKLDLGGIGVGYAIDYARASLEQAGIRRAFIDVSGDCFGMGTPPGEEGWPVRIAGSPRVVRLQDQALATSSNTMTVIELQNHVLGHVMDPARGCPVDTRRQVTVVASSAVDADALSTASLVTGRDHAVASLTNITE